MKSILTCKELSVGYGNNIVQNDINLTIIAGDYIAVIGNNGAGKSTFIKTILGLIPPVQGKVEYAPSIKNEGIGYLPQQGVVQKTFPTSVGEVILSGRQNKIKLFYSKADKEVAKETAKTLDVLSLWNRRYSELSGGQQQRVLLARALCATNKFLVLDEPLTGLDIGTQKAFYDTVERIHIQGTTVLMITHDANALDKGMTHVLEFGEHVTLTALDSHGGDVHDR